jgi:hypothetical protein
MKKIAIASMLALAATAASALEFGVTAARDYAGVNDTGYGITIGDRAGKGSIALGLQRFERTTNNQDVVSLVGGYDVAKVGPTTLAVKGGVAHLDNSSSTDGFAVLVGAGASLPINKTMSLTLDVMRQQGQDRVKQHDGTRVTAGIKVSF